MTSSAGPGLAAAFRRLVVGRDPRRTLVRAGMVALAAWALFGYALLPIRTDGLSMAPTYESGRLNFINRMPYLWREPARADVVGISMAGRRVMYLKRIVGLPGERVRIDEGTVFVNDRRLEEPHIVHRAPWTVPEISLGPDEYFVIGDNRGMAMGEHEFGTTRRARILGKVLF